MRQAQNSYEKQLVSAVAETGVTGASFAYWDGSQLHTAVAGLRNSVTADPVTVDTVMHIGSITKVMNTVLLMQLVDEGRVALEDLIVKHLPEFRLRDRGALQKITCAMLVNHTSGIDGEWLPEYGPDQERIVDTVERCAGLDQLFAPGEAASYCNVATVVAGYLVQELRGTSWYGLVKQRIYEPLGLRHALVDPLEVPRFRCSVGDLTDPVTGRLVQTTRPFLSPAFAPAGSTQMMTATDLVTFTRALLNGGMGINGSRILSAASAERMARPTAAWVPLPSEARQSGLGWAILPGGVLFHGGGGPGVWSDLYAHSGSGRVLALLRNCDRGAAIDAAIVAPILQSWTGIRKKRPLRQLGPIDVQPYVGTYQSNAVRIEVIARDTGLAMRIGDKLSLYDNSDAGEPFTTLYALGVHAFEKASSAAGVPNTEVRFVQPDGTGRMRFVSAWNTRLFRRTS